MADLSIIRRPASSMRVSDIVRRKARLACALHGKTPEETLEFMQMLGLVDDAGNVIDEDTPVQQLHRSYNNTRG